MPSENLPESPERGMPGEDEIKELLGQFQPRPSQRFYRRMQSAPWQPPVSSSSRRHSYSLIRNFVLAALALFIVLGSALALPAGRMVAEQLLHYFMPLATDTMTVPVTVPQPASTGTPQPSAFSLSLDQAQARVDFSVQQPVQLPSGLEFSGAQADPSLQAVILRYSGEGYTLFFTQRKLGKIQEYSAIGASAPVEIVRVHGVSGEYVNGGWRIISGSDPKQTPIPGTQVVLGVYWDTDLSQQTLRWQENGRMYEILISGKKLDKTALIQIAEQIK